MDFFNHDNMKSYRSGRLGEKFCKEHFRVSEPSFEVKCSSNRASSVVIQAWQLLEQLNKQYIVVKYVRAMKVVTRGPNKGRKRHTETIEQAFNNNKVLVYVIRGEKLMRIVMQQRLPVYSTAAGGNIMKYGKWGIIWRIPMKYILEYCTEVVAENDTYILHGEPSDPPSWIGNEVAKAQGGLFAGPKKKEEDSGGDEEVPF